ncbi:MAG: NifB/NifX family molybdenum-iron cluster-binding protein [Bacilli bacterium]
MIVAIATDNNQCSYHFGQCEGFKLYDVVDGKIVYEDFIKNSGHERGFLPSYLSSKGVNTIISSGMGSAAQDFFKKEDIEVIVGCKGSLNRIIQNYIDGVLVSDNSICDNHEFNGNCND